jgi:hypothetical protein
MTTTTIADTPPSEATTPIVLRFPPLLAGSALGLGIIADLLFYGRIPGISFPLFIACCLAALHGLAWFEQRPSIAINRWLSVAALFFAILAVIRVEPTILILNMVTALGLLLLQVGLFRGINSMLLSTGGYLLQGMSTAIRIGFSPFQPFFAFCRNLLSRSDRLRALIPVVRGLALALPIVGMFGILLMMADSLFADAMWQLLTLNLPFSIDWLAGHIILISVVGWASAGALLVALQSEPTATDAPLGYPKPWGLGWIEGLTVLIAVDTLFAGFMVVQAAYLFGGFDTVVKNNLTYADYARRGFFELVLVAILTLGLIWFLVRATRREETWQRQAFHTAAALLVFLTIGLLSSAFQRMWLYEEAYGFTHLRLYTHTFMIWLALALLLCLAALIADRPHWLSFGGMASAFVILALLTLANPEAIIVQANVARFQATGNLDFVGGQTANDTEDFESYRRNQELDANYLARLSEDATPALVAALPLLPAEEQATIRDALLWQQQWLGEVEQQGWPAWHWARATARNALQSLPIN